MLDSLSPPELALCLHTSEPEITLPLYAHAVKFFLKLLLRLFTNWCVLLMCNLLEECFYVGCEVR